MADYTKEELLARLDYLINAKEAKIEDLALLVFDPRFPGELFEDAQEDLEQALAVLKARNAQKRAQQDL